MDSFGYLDVFLRLGAAVLAGAVIGFNREIHKKPAGLRTMALVALGSAAFVVATASAATAVGVACGLALWPVVLISTGLGLLILVLEPMDEWLKSKAS